MYKIILLSFLISPLLISHIYANNNNNASTTINLGESSNSDEIKEDKSRHNIDIIKSWLSDPTDKEAADIVERFKSLDRFNLIKITKEAKDLPFNGQIILSGLLSQHPDFEYVYLDIFNLGTELDVAMALIGATESHAEKGWTLNQGLRNIRKNLIKSDNEDISRLMALTVAYSDYYSELIYKRLLENSELDFPNNSIGNNMEALFVNALEKITNTNAMHMSNEYRKKHFDKWLENNKSRLKPSSEKRKNDVNYTNYLYGFNLNLPISFNRIYEPEFTAGKICFFADFDNRSISIESLIKSKNLDEAFKDLQNYSKAIKISNIEINGYSAIKYKLAIDQGHFIGILADLGDRFLLSTVYSPFDSDRFEDVENIVNGVSFLEN